MSRTATKPNIGDLFSFRGARYRVKGFLRTYIPVPCEIDVIRELQEERALELEERNEVMVQACERDQAEFVAGTGVCGTVARIEDIEVDGVIEWPPERLEAERTRYSPDPDLRVTIYRYWDEANAPHPSLR